MSFWKPQPPNATTRFVATLPPSPLQAHIGHVHALMVHSGANEYAMQAGEHSLREIARYAPVRSHRGPDMSALAASAERMQSAIKDAMGKVEARLGRNLAALGSLPSPDAEARSEREYKRRIEMERAKGLLFVKQEGIRVRAELGLDG